MVRSRSQPEPLCEVQESRQLRVKSTQLFGQIFGLLRPASTSNVFRAREQCGNHVSDTARDQRGILEATESHGEIQSLLNQIDDSLRTRQLYPNLRVTLEELGQRRNHVVRERWWCRQANGATRLFAHFGGCGARLVHQGERSPDLIEVDATGSSEAELAGSALD
jgi:hypothetical protein